MEQKYTYILYQYTYNDTTKLITTITTNHIIVTLRQHTTKQTQKCYVLQF